MLISYLANAFLNDLSFVIIIQCNSGILLSTTEEGQYVIVNDFTQNAKISVDSIEMFNEEEIDKTWHLIKDFDKEDLGNIFGPYINEFDQLVIPNSGYKQPKATISKLGTIKMLVKSKQWFLQ